jgi:hypothetical protein
MFPRRRILPQLLRPRARAKVIKSAEEETYHWDDIVLAEIFNEDGMANLQHVSGEWETCTGWGRWELRITASIPRVYGETGGAVYIETSRSAPMDVTASAALLKIETSGYSV